MLESMQKVINSSVFVIGVDTEYESTGFLVRGPAKPHIFSILWTENGDPMDPVED